MRFLVGGVVLVASCVSPASVTCPSGLACPAGTRCTSVGTYEVCATDEQIRACDGLAPYAQCDAVDERLRCIGGVCFDGCGNEQLDEGEACDDGNAVAGDACSATCDSTEVCGNNFVDLIGAEECDGAIAGLSSDGCSSTCRLEIMRWRDVSPRAVTPRYSAWLAYDAARSVMVTFGGTNEFGTLDETWEREAGRWILRDPLTSPPGRTSTSLAYDAGRQRVVLFGGRGQGADLADTWLWDGDTWTELHPPVSPPARYGATLVYDAARDQVVLFGGRSTMDGYLADTWIWDGTVWTEATPSTAPSARSNHAAAYHATQQRVVVFSGFGDSGYNAETWEWDGASWAQVATATSPTATLQATMAFDAARDRIVLHVKGETWLYDGATWEMAASAPMPARGFAGLAYDSAAGTVVLLGGTGSGLHGDTWLWDGAWTQAPEPPVGPSARSYHAFAYDALRGELLLFGGDAAGVATGETWSFANGTWTERTPSAAPGPRSDTSMVYDRIRDRIVLFGGWDGSDVHYDDTWAWTGTTWTPIATPPANTPPARYDHGLAYDDARDRVVLFGGYSDALGENLDDTWELDGATWVARDAAMKPPARCCHAMAYDWVRQRTVLVGGEPDDGITWEWDGTTWEPVAPAPPGEHLWSSAVFDPARQRVVLALGNADDSGVWEWDGSTWTRQTPEGSLRLRYAAPAAYDSVGQRIVMFGGASADYFADTWAIEHVSPSERPERCRVATDDLDGDGLAGCADPDCWGRCAPKCEPGRCDDPAAVSPRCGDDVCDPVEDALLCPADCP